MTCCVVALALAWQLIALWRRLKSWLGIAERQRKAPRSLGVAAANAIDFFRRPAVRGAVLVALALEAGAAGAYVFNHRVHLVNEARMAVYDVTGTAWDLCRGVARD